MKLEDSEVLRRELSALYADSSKHSAYQSIPAFAAKAIGYQVPIDHQWRGDQIRLDYIERRLGSSDPQTWIDFGANTGFFALSLAHANPTRELVAIEANANHARFIERIARAFHMQNVRVVQKAVGIDDLGTVPRADVLLHLNVLHHAGFDFDKGLVKSAGDFVEYATAYLDRLRQRTDTLVLQLGSNLWGDKSRPLIDYRDDVGKLLLFRSMISQAGWVIDDCAYARRSGMHVSYDSLPRSALLERAPSVLSLGLASLALDAHPGEFYRRPLFVCRHRNA